LPLGAETPGGLLFREAAHQTSINNNKQMEVPMSDNATSAPFNWRAHLPVHPAADEFPLLSETDPKALQELAEDIRKNGLQSPIILWSESIFDEANKRMLDDRNRYLIDGRNRLDALALLGWLVPPKPRQVGRESVQKYTDRIKNYPFEISSEARPNNLILGIEWETLKYNFFEDRDEVYSFVLSANVHRRHLTTEQKRELIDTLLKRQPEMSDRHIGNLVKADNKTVATRRAKLEGREEIPHVETRTDSKGRKQPSSKGEKPANGESSTGKYVTLDEWKTLAVTERQALLSVKREDFKSIPKFNEQTNDSIEWADWSRNPVTGCQHTCVYCYARDIANRFYPHGFAPAIKPAALLTPRYATVPNGADSDTRLRNVFTCSMADLFGRWVPAEWIEAVLNEMRNAPQWNFLCLTKFPKRIAEFDIPPNAWMGTSVDLQARVTNAEAAFAKVKCGVKWVSVEPMLEPLKFKNLENFDWIAIGGASRSSETPEWHPPFEWILDLVNQARAAGTKVYFKTNLGIRKRLLELPFDAPIPQENEPAPAVFNYLGKKDAAQIAEAA
jgi:protein gp37